MITSFIHLGYLDQPLSLTILGIDNRFLTIAAHAFAKQTIQQTSQDWLVSVQTDSSIYKPPTARPSYNCSGVFTSCVACDKPLTVTSKQTQTTTPPGTRKHNSKESDLQGISREDEVWKETKLVPLNPMPPQFYDHR